MRKKTHEQFLKEVIKKYGDEYEILGEYVNAKTKIKVKHIKCEYEWETTPNKLLQGRGCPVCGKKKGNQKRTKTHEKFIQEIKDKYDNEYKVLGEYKNAKTKILIKHKCGYEYKVNPDSLLRGCGCPVCSNPPKIIILGVNTIWDTDKWMVDIGVSEEDAKKYTRCSNKKVIVKCPDCGRKKKMMISNIYRHGSIGCSCGDGKSYPEKFVFNLLEQLDADFEIEYKPKWIENKKYDFYIKDNSCIIETHGEQHYKQTSRRRGRSRTLEEEQANDKYKKEMAFQNNIKHYIELDCRNSNMEWIKSSILKSELNKLFDLSRIDWNKCAEFANKNIVKEVCDYWNNKKDGETTANLGRMFNLNGHTVNRYLKKGIKLGWCKYDSKEEKGKAGKQNGKSNCKKVEIFKNNQSLGMFESCSELERQSEELFGVKLFQSNIGYVCLGKRKSHKGFTFKYVEEDNNLNINKIA